MSSYIRTIAADAKTITLNAIESVQRFVAGGLLQRAENAEITLRSTIRGLETHNRFLATQSLNLRRALDARNVRAGTDALISGRTRFGDIVSDTASTYDEVYLPTHKVTIKVTNEDFTVKFEDDTVNHEVREFDTQGLEPGLFRQINARLA